MKNLRLWVAVAAAGVCVNQDSAAQSGDVEPTTPISVETPTPAAGFVKPGNFLRAIPLSSLSTTRDRPLFSSSRRPPPPAVAAPLRRRRFWPNLAAAACAAAFRPDRNHRRR